jgi:stage II sporulation protein D
VAATAGQVITYAGAPAVTYFFASSGGRTESVENAWPGSLAEPWLRSVSDPYDGGPLHSWALTIPFSTATARLRSLVRGGFRGIEVLRRGFSPRILAANIIGSRGRTLVSGGELAARLGMYDTWAYFSVRHGLAISAEPDRSGRLPSVSFAAPTPAVPGSGAAVTPRTGAQGGVRAEGGAASSPARLPVRLSPRRP